MQFFMDCKGCILEPQKHDRVVILSSNGNRYSVGIQLQHDLSVHLYNVILEAAKAGGTIEIPNFEDMDDDAIREALGNLKIK